MLSKTILHLCILLIMPSLAQAKDLGVHGRVYGIKENDLLTVLQSRAQGELDSGEWDKRVKKWRDQAKKQTSRPAGILLPRATEITSHLYDPTLVVPDDIKDANGFILHRAGTRINPLSYITMTRHLLFIDGDDQEQIDWMMQTTKSEPERFKVVLTQGNVIDLMTSLDRRLFFDQKQQYVQKLSINSLPALVYQQGLYLRIDEVAIP
jgi:conjugal transfer pilus assembly protein TraW